MYITTYEARISKNISLLKLEKLTGIGKSTLNDIENNKYSPKLEQLEIIAQALNMRITDLFESDYK